MRHQRVIDLYFEIGALNISHAYLLSSRFFYPDEPLRILSERELRPYQLALVTDHPIEWIDKSSFRLTLNQALGRCGMLRSCPIQLVAFLLFIQIVCCLGQQGGSVAGRVNDCKASVLVRQLQPHRLSDRILAKCIHCEALLFDARVPVLDQRHSETFSTQFSYLD